MSHFPTFREGRVVTGHWSLYFLRDPDPLQVEGHEFLKVQESHVFDWGL